MEPLMPEEVPVAVELPGPYGYLELLNRSGRVINRIAVTDAGLSIGRGYGNDLILDDPYVCPQHAQIRWNGRALEVEVLPSVNGISSGEQKCAERFTLECDSQISIGRTLLRFRSVDYRVPATLVDHHLISPFRLLEKPLFQAAVFLVAIVMILLESYLDAVTKIELLKFVPSVVAMLVVIFIWSMLWAFASRLVQQKWRFWTHSAVALSGFILLQSVEVGWGYFAFAFAVNGGENLFLYLMSTLLLGLLVFLHLHFVTVAPWQRLARKAAGVAVVVVGLALAVNLANKDDFSQNPEYNVTLKAPMFKLARSQTSAEFFQQVEKMMVRVDAEIAEDKNK